MTIWGAIALILDREAGGRDGRWAIQFIKAGLGYKARRISGLSVKTCCRVGNDGGGVSESANGLADGKGEIAIAAVAGLGCPSLRRRSGARLYCALDVDTGG